MQWTTLPTDWFLYALIAISVIAIHRARQQQDVRAAWQQIFARPVAMASFIIVLAYSLIALLDSIHFTQAGHVISVLDMLMQPLNTFQERSYSAPFALYAFVKEAIYQPDGTWLRTFPPLEYVPSQLLQSTHQAPWILQKVLSTSLKITHLFVIAGFIHLIYLFVRYPPQWSQRFIQLWFKPDSNAIAWRTVILTIYILALLWINLWVLAGDFHVFGTDKVGNDGLYETLKSIRTGIIIGTLTTLIMLPFAIILGIAAGYFGGWIDDLIQYLYTTLSSIPGILLIAAAVLSLQVYMSQHADSFTSLEFAADARLLALCIILGITSWSSLCRLLRAETLKLREMEFIQAAKTLGSSHIFILWRHLLPNLMHIVLIATILDFSGLVLAEAVLSYVGAGVDPTSNSWGLIINQARLELAREPAVWWPLLAAFSFMFVLVLCANLFADAVREAFDPRMRKISFN